MRPLNRPMFKMGGSVKEGIMDGIREPRQDYFVGGTVAPILTAISTRAAPLLARAKGLFGTNVARQFTPVARQTITTGGRNPGTMLGGFQRTGPTQTVTSFQPNRLSKFFTNDPILGLVLNPTAGGVIKKGAQKVLKGALTTPTGLLTTGFIGKGFLGDDSPEIEGGSEQKAELPGQDPKGGANVDSKVEVNQQGGSAPSNQFNDDGTKKIYL